MPETDISMQGLDAYIDKFTKSPEKLIENIRKKALKLSEDLAGKQRMNCPVETGALRESIETFLERDGDTITAGTRTNNEYALYVEMGTGPAGDRNGHPLDKELGVVRKTEKWKVHVPGVGYRYTEGQAAQPFMYTGMKEMESEITNELGSAVTEVFK